MPGQVQAGRGFKVCGRGLGFTGLFGSRVWGFFFLSLQDLRAVKRRVPCKRIQVKLGSGRLSQKEAVPLLGPSVDRSARKSSTHDKKCGSG